ncbi:hypothetical protein [Rhodococcus erythropolis]|uniref:DUF7210 family protein n=1 Tax=Rhodococcus erythropolis TaxID=1833 RepID=UPI0030135DA0
MTKVTLIGAVRHDGKDYKPGDTFEGSTKVVQDLIRAGAAQDPSIEVDVPTELSDETVATAKAIVADAVKAAEKIKSDAEGEATDIIGKAEAEARLKVEEAEQVLTNAKAEAEKLVETGAPEPKETPTLKPVETKPSEVKKNTANKK